VRSKHFFEFLVLIAVGVVVRPRSPPVKENSMAKRVLLEEFHLSFFVSNDRPDSEALAARRRLKSAAFRRKLRSIVAAAIRRMPSLRHVSFEVSW
jgi:hypothetical protein